MRKPAVKGGFFCLKLLFLTLDFLILKKKRALQIVFFERRLLYLPSSSRYLKI